MSVSSSVDLRDAVQNLVLDFFMDLDVGAFEALVGRMAPGGRWHRQGKVLSGRQNILDAMAERGPDVRTAHLVTNLRIVQANETAATARFYMTAFRYDGAVVAGAPSPMNLPGSIGLYECDCTLIENGWRIEELRADPRFRR